jgi:hypothetical protein
MSLDARDSVANASGVDATGNFYCVTNTRGRWHPFDPRHEDVDARHMIALANVPRFTVRSEDAARRFISLVDEFYDRGVKLVVSAEAPPEQLYRGERLAFEFERTRSRLAEMQTHEYLARAHRP